MKRILSAFLACVLLSAEVPMPDAVLDRPMSDEAAPMPMPDTGSAPNICLDGMEAQPFNDDLIPVPANMIDGGCRAQSGVIFGT